VIYRFGRFELDPSAGELRREGRALPLQPKPLAMLTLLIQERHRIVPNDELLDRLWPGETVTQGSLTRAVSVARAAIGDSGRAGLIRSHTRRGYRFHGDVVVLDSAPPVAATGHAPDGRGSEGTLPFVGREAAIARLRAAWDRATRGFESLVVVSGPAGVGKTRLTEVFEREVESRGGLPLRGRALEEEGEPAFWVWAQILRRLLREDPDSLSVPGLAASEELAALLPELAPLVPGAASRLPQEQRRFVFFDAVARALRAGARKRPLLVIFEDLHWADPASLRLLEHVAFELADAQVLVIATVRDAPSLPDDPSIRTLSALRRKERIENVTLGRLGAQEVELLVATMFGRPIPKLAGRLHARTGGLPLFLREACRHLEEAGATTGPERWSDDAPFPPADWVRDALSGLGDACARLVGAAAVIGRDFPLSLAAAAAEIDRGDALDLLDAATRAGVIEAHPEDPVRFRFVHDLFREAAYEALPPGARVRLHHRTASQLERQHGEHAERILAELAHHHHRSLAIGDPERAYASAMGAARQAFAACAYEQAGRHAAQALDALTHSRAADDRRRLDTLLTLGEASRLAGERRQRQRTFGEVLQLARDTGAPDAFASAAIGLCDLAEWGVRDDFARAAVVEALEQLVRPAPELEAKLLTRLGYLDAIFEPRQAEERLRRAVALTRELGAADPLEEALYALHFVLGGPDAKQERVLILDELRRAAAAARDPVASLIALLDVACDRIELGDPSGAARLRREADAIAGDPPHPVTLWHRRVYDCGLALMEGRLDEIEGRAEEARELGWRIQHPYAQGCTNAHLSQLRALRGDAEGVLDLLEPTLGARQGPTEWVCALVARSRFAIGRNEEARSLFDAVLEKGSDAIPRNLRWMATQIELAHCCADLLDAERAAALIELLAPFEHDHGVMPMVICYGGPVAWALARLHEVRGRADDAGDLYREALPAARGLGARPTEAQIRVSYGRFLRRRRQRSQAREEFSAAAAVAAELGMTALEHAALREREE
jgi:DNA-binding winged helix-turn-helix (wHTH) protein/tetratricopeptide (TPR) repeat protein